MRIHQLALFAALAVTPLSRADDRTALAPFLDERTVLVGRVDLTRLDVLKLVQRLADVEKIEGTSPSAEARELVALLSGMVADRATVVYLVASLADLPDSLPFLVIPLPRDVHLDRLTKRLAVLKKYDPTLGVSRIGSTLILATASVFKRLQTLEPTDRPDVFTALGKETGIARLAVVPTTDTRRILEEVMPTLPMELGGGSSASLARGFRHISLDLLEAPTLHARLTVQASDAAAAVSLEDLLGRILRSLATSKEIPEARKLSAYWKPKREGDRILVTVNEKQLAGMLRAQVEQLILTERQSKTTSQLRTLVQAMHAYLERHGTFPPQASHDGKDRPLLSWRVHLLPFLGEDKLYKEFRLDEPWDSGHNRKLLPRMPTVYRPQSIPLAEQFRTTYLVPVGEPTMFPGKRGVRIADVADGTVTTILLVDVADDRAVEWTRPQDLPVQEKGPAGVKEFRHGLSNRHGGRMLVVTADGSVHALPGTTPPQTLWWLFTRAGGEVVTLP